MDTSNGLFTCKNINIFLVEMRPRIKRQNSIWEDDEKVQAVRFEASGKILAKKSYLQHVPLIRSDKLPHPGAIILVARICTQFCAPSSKHLILIKALTPTERLV